MGVPIGSITQACVDKAAWRNGIASDYDSVIRRLQVRPLRWSFSFHHLGGVFPRIFLLLLLTANMAHIARAHPHTESTTTEMLLHLQAERTKQYGRNFAAIPPSLSATDLLEQTRGQFLDEVSVACHTAARYISTYRYEETQSDEVL